MRVKNKEVVYAWKFRDYHFHKEHIFYLKRYSKNEYRLMAKKEGRDKILLPKRRGKYLYIPSEEYDFEEEAKEVIREIENKVIEEKAEGGKYEVIKNTLV